MAIKIEEKIELAKEVGALAQAAEWESIQQMTSVKFKPITVEKIKEMLCSKPYKTDFVHKNTSDVFMSSINRVFMRCWTGMSGTHYCGLKDHQVETPIYPVLDSMDLEQWKDGLPYGALLALKEAKEAKIEAFRIYYPSTEGAFLRRHDPVIVGLSGKISKVVEYNSILECPVVHQMEIGKHTHKSIINLGKMVEIFSWDDGKVYE